MKVVKITKKSLYSILAIFFGVVFLSSLGHADQSNPLAGIVTNAPANISTESELTKKFLLVGALRAKQTSEQCQSIEVRSANDNEGEVVFKYGVGSLFTVENKPDFYVLTVAHLVGHSQALLGICETQAVDLELVGIDTTIDVAVLKVRSKPSFLSPLFDFSKGKTPEYAEIEKLTDTSLLKLKDQTVAGIEYADLPEHFSRDEIYFKFERQSGASNWDSAISFPRRRSIYGPQGRWNILAILNHLLPADPLTYSIAHLGVRPGMSGSPVFLNQKIGSSLITEPIMVGIVSKTKINAPESALVPFNLIVNRLPQLLEGLDSEIDFVSNDSFSIKGFIFRNLGLVDFKNSADEYVISKTDQKEKLNPDIKYPSLKLEANKLSIEEQRKKLRLKEILKNDLEIRSYKIKRMQSKGGDWGEGGGDIAQANSGTEYRLSGSNDLASYISHETSSSSGVIDSQGKSFYALQNGNTFVLLRSIFSLLPFSDQNLTSLVSSYGISDPQLAFQNLCRLPVWQGLFGQTYYQDLEVYPYEDYYPRGFFKYTTSYRLYKSSDVYVISRNYEKINRENHDKGSLSQIAGSNLHVLQREIQGNAFSPAPQALCQNGTIYAKAQGEAFDIDLQISQTRVQGHIKIGTCTNQINVSTGNIWERSLSTENFSGKLQLGAGQDFLVKLNVLDINPRCDFDSESIRHDNLLTTITIR
jgi:hypothetical protein